MKTTYPIKINYTIPYIKLSSSNTITPHSKRANTLRSRDSALHVWVAHPILLTFCSTKNIPESTSPSDIAIYVTPKSCPFLAVLPSVIQPHMPYKSDQDRKSFLGCKRNFKLLFTRANKMVHGLKAIACDGRNEIHMGIVHRRDGMAFTSNQIFPYFWSGEHFLVCFLPVEGRIYCFPS